MAPKAKSGKSKGGGGSKARGNEASGGKPTGAVTAYLIAYNAISAVGWTMVLATTLAHLLHRGTAAKLGEAVHARTADVVLCV